ncbi:hypothetical protein [Streptomyces sp. NPDC001502]|uniref:hypothetical protein n=1 Tax=Streptomyces sp. NPDC001502 TaxID=3364578 RepID=UPI0036CD1023
MNLTDPTNGYLNFVLITEARLGIASASQNGEVSIEPRTPHAEEWVSRLVRCEPNAMHCMLVEPEKIPALFHPCVEEDKNSPSAVRDPGCACRRTLYDPAFGLPVVGEHFERPGEDGVDQWTYRTYAPLDLRPDDTFSRFIVSRGLFWARTAKGLLSILPQRRALGYGIGYRGGGPHALAAYLSQVAETDGRNTAAGALYEKAHPAILSWTQSGPAHRATNELTLHDLKAMQRV